MISLLVTMFNIFLSIGCILSVLHAINLYDDIKSLMIDLDFLYNRIIDFTEPVPDHTTIVCSGTEFDQKLDIDNL